MKTGVELIAEERQRQIDIEGYNEEHDSQHKVSEFISAAGSYADSAVMYALKEEGATNDALTNGIPFLKKSFVWGYDAFKPTGCLKDLIKAGALIAAAIDRLQNKNK
jgi:hypothetical protein